MQLDELITSLVWNIGECKSGHRSEGYRWFMCKQLQSGHSVGHSPNESVVSMATWTTLSNVTTPLLSETSLVCCCSYTSDMHWHQRHLSPHSTNITQTSNTTNWGCSWYEKIHRQKLKPLYAMKATLHVVSNHSIFVAVNYVYLKLLFSWSEL